MPANDGRSACATCATERPSEPARPAIEIHRLLLTCPAHRQPDVDRARHRLRRRRRPARPAASARPRPAPAVRTGSPSSRRQSRTSRPRCSTPPTCWNSWRSCVASVGLRDRPLGLRRQLDVDLGLVHARRAHRQRVARRDVGVRHLRVRRARSSPPPRRAPSCRPGWRSAASPRSLRTPTDRPPARSRSRRTSPGAPERRRTRGRPGSTIDQRWSSAQPTTRA